MRYDEPFLVNPAKRRKRRKSSGKRRRRRNPALAMVGNPKRRRRSGGKRRRSYRSNPVGGIKNITGRLTNVLPLAVTGIASGVVTNMVPGFLGLANPWMNHGAKAAVALLGGPVVGNMVGREHGTVWTVVGIASVVQDLVKQFMPGVIPGLGYQYPNYYQSTEIGAFPNEVDGVGAFPNEVDGMGNYPEGSEYLNTFAEMGESPYPY